MRVRFPLARIMIKNNLNYFYKISKNKIQFTKKIKYKFLMISLISPFIISNINLTLNIKILHDKKLFLKQSYMLLAWFYYLSFINFNKKTANINFKNKLKIMVLPTFTKKFTATKAPMAHKTWSKEQYKFQFFKFQIWFNSTLKEKNYLTTLNSGLLFIFLSKKSPLRIESNILFLKNYKFFFYLKDLNYFNYFKFLNN